MMKSIFAACIGLAFGLLLAEAGVRIWLRLASRAAPWNDRPKFYFAAAERGALQDYPSSETKDPGVFRIAVVGDSYTFAPYMQFTDTFPKKLEEMLNLKRQARRAEVINYGVPAYSTSHEVGVVKRALRQQADLVLLQITLNDPEIKPYHPTGIGANDNDRFGELRPQGWQKSVFRYWKTAELVTRRVHNTQTKQAYARYFNRLFEKPDTWANFRDSLRRLVKLCRDAKTPVAAVVFPLFGLPLDDEYPFHPSHQKVGALLAKLKVPYLDLYTTYAGIPIDRLQVIPVKDRHPNEIAHRMAAEELYVWLMQQGLLPAELRIPKAYQTRLGIVNQPGYEHPAIGMTQ